MEHRLSDVLKGADVMKSLILEAEDQDDTSVDESENTSDGEREW
jgi:hypothetical protein